MLPPIGEWLAMRPQMVANFSTLDEQAAAKPWRPWETPTPEPVLIVAPEPVYEPRLPMFPPSNPPVGLMSNMSSHVQFAAKGWGGRHPYLLSPDDVRLGGTRAHDVASTMGMIQRMPFDMHVAARTVDARPTGRNPPTGDADDDKRVTIWNTREKRKLSGNAAPFKRNLSEYLALHPEWEVYTTQDQGLPRKKRRRNNATMVEREVHDRRVQQLVESGVRDDASKGGGKQNDSMASLLWAIGQDDQ